MRRRRSGRLDDEAEVDLTPMLDVVFIMLIFFIVTSSFLKEVGLDLNRPEGGSTTEVVDNENIFIQISNDGIIYVDRRVTDLRAVRPNIERISSITANKQGISTRVIGVANKMP